jgi:lipopolysaccharide exporter
VLTPTISDLFEEPTLSPILRALGVSCLFQGFSMTGVGLLLREHRYRELSTINVGTYAFGFLVVGVGSAMLGAGVWSLVAASLVTYVAQVVWQYALLPHPVRPVLRWAPYRAICGYGMRLSGAHLMDHVGSNLDTLVVGRVASAAVLGQYSRAYYLVFQPLRLYLSQALENVLFSHLSRIQDDAARLRRAYDSLLALGSTVLFSICAGMAVAAPELVAVVLGPQWSLAATIVPWFAFAGGLSVISRLSQVLAEARADLNRSLIVQGAYLLALVGLLGVALGWRSRGVWVFAAAVAGGELFRHLGYLELMRRVLSLRMGAVAQSYAAAVLTSLGVGLAIAVARRMLLGHLPTLGTLAVEVAVGALALALCIRFYPQPFVRRELRMRLTAVGAMGEIGGLRWRLGRLLLGQPEPATSEPRP